MLLPKGARDILFIVAGYFAAAIVIISFIAILSDIAFRGISGLSFSFVLSDPLSAGRLGGIRSVIVSTLFIVSICCLVSVPIALGTTLYLSTFIRPNGKVSTSVRICLDVLSSTPSIVFGLFGSAFFCVYLDLGFSTLSGGLTLSCMILPSLIRLTENALNNVQAEHRLNATALGLSKTSVFIRILLPLSAPALGAALVLSIGRALSETAALLFTSGYVLRMPRSLLDSGRSLSVHIYDLALNVPGGDANAYASALVLVTLLLLINLSALGMMNYFTKQSVNR